MTVDVGLLVVSANGLAVPLRETDCGEATLFLRRFAPVAVGDIGAMYPDLADQVMWALAVGGGVDDPQRG